MHRLFRPIAILFLLLLVASPAVAEGILKIPGTGDSQAVLRKLARAFEKARPGTQIEIPGVLRTACTQNRRWAEAGFPPMKLAVNLSARQLRDPGLVEMIDRVLNETGLDPSLLELELTESMLMETVEGTITLMHRLKALGLSLAIDDFGTGYSSLSYLKRFPIDTLKIDRSFVGDLHEEDDAAIIRAIIALAETLNIRVVAEGVETDLQLDFLRRSGCDEIQGYLFSRPVAHEDFAQLLSRPALGTPPRCDATGTG